MGWDTHPRGTCWVPRCHGCARIWGTQGMSWAVSFQQPPSVAHGQPAARLNAARPVCGEACPVQLDFWRGWSQPRHQPLPARCCRLRQSRARRRVVAPSPRGRHSPRMGHAGPAPCSVLCADAVAFFGGTVPHGTRERAAPSLLEGSSSLWGPCPEEVEKVWNHEDNTQRCPCNCRGAF